MGAEENSTVCYVINRSVSLIVHLKESKVATGRKRSHCDVCLVDVGDASRGEAAGLDLKTSCLCVVFKVSGRCVHIPYNMTVKGTFRTLKRAHLFG